MVIIVVLGLSLGSAVLVVLAAYHQDVHKWRGCTICGVWFDRAGLVVEKLPFVGRFAMHGDEVCPGCVKEIEAIDAEARGGGKANG